MMGRELDHMRSLVTLDHTAVRNPDRLPVNVHGSASRPQYLFLWARTRKEWPMHDCDGKSTGRIGNLRRKQAGVLVVNPVERDAVIGSESRKPHASPIAQVFGDGESNARPVMRQRRVGHYVVAQSVDVGYTGVFAAATAVFGQFIISFGLQRDSQPFDTLWIADAVE